MPEKQAQVVVGVRPGGADAPPVPLDRQEERLWRALARVLVAVPKSIDDDLQARCSMSSTDYTVLMHLSEAPERRLRPSTLAALMALSPSRITRAVEALVQRGWVERLACPEDRRGTFAAITDDGVAALEGAWPSHVESVRHHVISRIREADMAVVTASLEAVTPPPPRRARGVA